MFANNTNYQKGGVIPILIVSLLIFSFIAWYGQKSQSQMAVIASTISLTNEARVKMNNAATLILGYATNIDSDDYLEPPEYTLISGNPSVDSYANYETDPWGENFIYCPYDIGNGGHPVEGEKDPSKNIFKGNGKTSGANNQNIVIALISKGKNKSFESSCLSSDEVGNIGPSRGGDDIVMIYSHAMAYDQVSSNQTVSGVNIETHVFSTRAEFESTLNGRSHGSVHQVDIQNTVGGVTTQEGYYPLVFNKTGFGALSMGFYNRTSGSGLKFQKNDPHFLELVGSNANLTVSSTSGAININVNSGSTPGLHTAQVSGSSYYWWSLVEDGLYLRRSLTTSKTITSPRAYLSKTKGFRNGDISAGDTRAISFDPRNDLGLHWQSSTTGTTNGYYHSSSVGSLNIINDLGMMLFQRKFNKNTTGNNSYDTTVANNAACESIYTGLIVRDSLFKILVCN